MDMAELIQYLEEELEAYDQMVIDDMYDLGAQQTLQEIYCMINQVP